MALKYKELREREENTPLSPREERFIDEVEGYIDKEILKQWDKGRVDIDLSVADFKYDPLRGGAHNFNQYRRKKMSDNLDKRFRNADWTIERFIDTSGGMGSRDLYILRPKSK